MTRFLSFCRPALAVVLLLAPATAFADNMSGMKMSTMKSMAGKPTSMASAGPVVKLGPLTISGPFARAMLPGQPTGGGYFTVVNSGTTADTLLAASSPAAGSVSLHEMKMNGNVMQMRPLPGGIPIPAGATVVLSPNGYHLMFEKVTAPFKLGGSVPVTLTFAKAGKVTIALPVGSIGATGPGH